jgi:DNA-binding GntR family transcriptional regulator
MRDDLRQGHRTPAELKTMLEKNLAATYGVSRDTARKTRNAVLAEFGEN